MKRGVVAFASGAVFSAGLSLSGMTKPAKVLAFLDVAGSWDPSLAFVMVGAIAVTAIAFRASVRRGSPVPVLEDELRVPSVRARIDAKLVVGAAVFGLGWGLSGLCPGPAVVSLASGQLGAILYVASMIAGMAIHRGLEVSFGDGNGASERRSAPSP
jgi:uncharacterized membrane protein YedE/YeeE